MSFRSGIRVSFALLLLLAAAGNALAQGTPAVARLTRWDIHAATGGTTAPAEGTYNLSDIARDTSGNVWVLGQGAGNVRIGRIATTNPANVTYTEWKVFRYGEDGEPRGLVVTPAGDVWMSVGGPVPFVRKQAGGNTFLNFRRDGGPKFSPHQMAMAADASRIFVAGADQAGRGYIVTVATSLGAGPNEVALPAWTAPPAHRYRFQPEDIAVDPAQPNVVWFTTSGDPSDPASTLARLDVSSGRLLEWPVRGLSAAGLYLDASRVCVVTRGSLAEPPTPAGDVECLTIPADVPSTPANEMATTAAKRQRFNRSAAGVLDLPEQIVGAGAGLFVSERGGDAMVFIGAGASADVAEDYVAPASLQLEQEPLGGFRIQDDWEGTNQPRLSVPMPSATVTLAGSQIGASQVRFGIPSEPQENLESLMRHPHPTAMTPVFFPNGPDGPAAMYVTESFHSLRGATYLGGRVDRFELPAAPIIKVTDALGAPVSTVSLSANIGAATAPTQQLLISNAGPGSLDWVASATATGFSVTVSPVTSGLVSGTASASITLTPTIPSQAGLFTGTLTISSPSTLDVVTIPVAFTVNGPPLLTANRTELAFRTNRLPGASDGVELANAPYRRAVTWQATGPQWLTITPATGSISGGQRVAVTVAVNGAATPVNVPQTAELTFFDPADPTAPNTRVVIPVTLTLTAPKIVLDQSSIAFPAILRGARTSRAVTLANAGTGDLNATIAVTPGATWLGASLPGSTPIPAGESRTLTVAVDTFGLSTGTTHTATITVSDPNAADLPLHQVQPPQQITVSVEVMASGEMTLLYGGVPVSPTTPIAVDVIKGIDTVVMRNFQVTNTGTGSFVYAATAMTQSGGSWLSVDGAASATVTTTQAGALSLKFTNFPAPGVYDGQVALTLTSGTASNAPLTLPVRLTVKGGGLALLPGRLTFDTPRWTVCNGSTLGANPATQNLVITNDGDRPVWYLVAASTATGGSWLSVSPAGGVLLPRSTRTVSVSVDAKSLAQGALAGTLTVHRLTNPSQSYVIDSQAIPVALNVGPAPARLCVSPASLDFGGLKQTVSSAAKTVTVRNAGDGQLAWSATAAASDGSVTLTKNASTLAVVVRTGMKKGSQTGRVTVSAPGVASQVVTLNWSVTDRNGGGDDDHDDCDRHEHDHGNGHDNGRHDEHDHNHDGRCDHDHDRDGHDCDHDHDHDRGDERDHCRGDHDRDGDHDDNDHRRHRHGYDRD